MAGIFVQLDADYDSDDRLIEAGVLAELLYVRSLAFAKRTLSDGKVTKSQLIIVGRGIPSVERQAAALVRVGAWSVTSKGWHITAWSKRNKSAAAIKAQAAAKKAAGIKANHERWHVDGKTQVSCPHCYPTTDPTTDPTLSDGGPLSESTYTESETEPYTEPETETQPAAAPADRSTGRGSSPFMDHPAAAAALELFIDHRQQQVDPENVLGFRITLRGEESRAREQLMLDHLRDNPDTDAPYVLEHVFGLSEMTVWRLTGQARRSA